jgi:hypothetical protein
MVHPVYRKVELRIGSGEDTSQWPALHSPVRGRLWGLFLIQTVELRLSSTRPCLEVLYGSCRAGVPAAIAAFPKDSQEAKSLVTGLNFILAFVLYIICDGCKE